MWGTSGPCPRCWMIGFRRLGRPHTTTHPPRYQLVSRRPGTGILLALPGAIRHFQVAHNRCGLRGSLQRFGEFLR